MPIDSIHNESELLQRIADGDGTAFREIVLRYSGLLYTYVFKHIESKETAEELVQDVFTQIWLTRETLRELRNFRTYLYVVSRNQALNLVKKMARDHRLKQKYQELSYMQEPEEQAVERERRLSIIEEAIEKLPPQQKRAWVLSRIKKLTYHQAAQEMGISRETIKTYLQHAHTFIAKYLAERMDMILALWLLK